MRKEEVYTGYRIYDDDMNLIGFQGDYNGEGYVFKDILAFEERPDDICYIPEGSFDDKGEFADFISVEEAKTLGETHKTIADQVRDAWGEDYMLTDEQVEYFTKDVFGIAEWACIATYLAENYELDDSIEFDGIKDGGIYTKFQYEAVMNGMTPKEYAERSLSYGEIIQFDEEFDEAFVHDDDCPDDESENGLGVNARITYQLERRDGSVSGPEEFADIHNVKEEWRKFAKQ